MSPRAQRAQTFVEPSLRSGAHDRMKIASPPPPPSLGVVLLDPLPSPCAAPSLERLHCVRRPGSCPCALPLLHPYECAAPFMRTGRIESGFRRHLWRSLTSRLSGPGFNNIEERERTAGRRKSQPCAPASSRLYPLTRDRFIRACTIARISSGVPATPRACKYRASSSPVT